MSLLVMDHLKGRSESTTRDFKIKDTIFAFFSLTFVCFTIILALVIYDVLPIQNLLSFDNFTVSILITAISSVALLVFGVVLTLYIPSKYIDDTNKTYQDDSLSTIFIFMFVVALFEETLFRGIIQNLFLVFTDNLWVAILSTTFLFLGFHINYFKKPIMLLNICIPSLVFGWVYVKTNNLLVPVFVHFIMNFGMTIFFKYNLIRFKK